MPTTTITATDWLKEAKRIGGKFDRALERFEKKPSLKTAAAIQQQERERREHAIDRPPLTVVV